MGLGDSRFWGELGFYTGDALGADVTVISPMLGFATPITGTLEIEAILPLSYASVEVNFLGQTQDDSAFILGAPYIGVNHIDSTGSMRYRIGGGIALGFQEYSDLGEGLAAAGGILVRGRQDQWLYWPERVSLVVPFRIEGGDDFVWSVDAAAAVLIPTDSGDTEIVLQPAPGIGFPVGGSTIVGARLPIVWDVTRDGDNAQISLEPFVRAILGESGFFLARFTMPIDEPQGFAFDDDGTWGLHVGGGAGF